MHVYKAIIVDDERLARQELKSLLSENTQVSIVGEASTLDQAVQLIEQNKPDLIFLDIQLGSEQGFELFSKLPVTFKIIFVTAYDEYAIRAFEVNALDYLLKPVNPQRLAEAVSRLHESNQGQDQRILELDDRLLLDMSDAAQFVAVQDIVYIQAAGDYSQLYLSDNKSILVEKSLKEWDARLPVEHFARVHRSTIVQLACIERLQKKANRTMTIWLYKVPKSLQVSRRYSQLLRTKFG